MACPGLTALTAPALVTVATAELLVSHVPRLVGLKVVLSPIQSSLSPVMLTLGPGVTVITLEVSETQPVKVFVKINLAVPAASPVIKPALLMVATGGLVLIHVPPVVGDKLVVLPTQILPSPFSTTIGLGLTVIGFEFSDTQPCVDVNLKVATPGATPVTTPVEALTVATDGLLLIHVPVSDACNVEVIPIQMVFEPVTVTVGLGLTTTPVI